MEDLLLKKTGANFFGFESIDSFGKHHFNPFSIKGTGDLQLTNNGVQFNQWGTQKEYNIPLSAIFKVELKAWHNFKMKWPGKVLRIHYKEGENTKIFGVRIGGLPSISKGWHDDAYLWKEKIESLITK